MFSVDRACNVSCLSVSLQVHRLPDGFYHLQLHPPYPHANLITTLLPPALPEANISGHKMHDKCVQNQHLGASYSINMTSHSINMELGDKTMVCLIIPQEH